MKAVRLVAIGMLLLALGLPAARAQTYIWTGLGTGWQGQVVPPNNGSADFYLGDAINETVPLTGNFNVASILLSTDDSYTIAAAAPLILGIGGAFVSPTNSGRLQFDPNITLDLNGAAAFDAGNGTIVVPGQITGSPTAVTLTASGPNGFFVFDNPGAGNTYSADTVIAAPVSDFVGVAFWSSSPFGTGTVSIYSHSQFVAHNSLTVANPLSFETTVANDPIIFKSWDAPLNFSGPVTLFTDTTFNAQVTQHFIPAADGSGVFASPGPGSRNPIVFSGSISQSGGAQSLTVNGQGLVMLTGSGNTYAGGTVVNGSLVFTPSALPTGGGTITVSAGGYVGVAAPASGTFNPADFASLLANFDLNSAGSVGIDTLPGNATTVLTAPISLSGFTNPAIRLGTATSAILQGTITPQGYNYQFGNGGGALYVQSNLVDVSGGFGPPSQLLLTSLAPSPPLQLYLQGANTYTSSTVVTDSFLVFDGASALPAYSQLTAAGSAAASGASYIGYSDAVGGMNAALFLAQFNHANTYGILGFDTHAGNSTVVISDSIDLTGFNNGVFLGTATGAILSGSLTPSTVTNSFNVPNTLRFTAALGSTLTVTSTLADLNGGTTPLGVMVGVPAALSNPEQSYSDGTVVISPATANTYTGGTTLNTNGPLTLSLAGTTPLGTGPLTIVPNGTAPVGLSVANGTLANNIVLQPPTGTQFPATLYLTGSNNFVLSGNISGYGDLVLSGASGLGVTLSGNNSGYGGDLDVFDGQLTLAGNTAAGTGNLFFDVPTAKVVFTSSAPTLYGISGDYGSLVVPDGSTLTFDTTNSSNSAKFGGSISGSGSNPTTAALVVTAGAPTSGVNALYLYGASNYTGGTTVTNYGILGIGNAQALGSGMVTVNAPGGGLAVNTGITFTNPLTFTAGGLGGYGTFAPSNLSNITFGPGQRLLPGLPGLSPQSAGTLTFQTDVTFANGGVYEWSLQDGTRPDGISQVVVNGNFNIAATAGGFFLQLVSFDSTGHVGPAVFDPNSPASWMIAQTTGTLSGFSTGAFTIDPSAFEGGLYGANQFSLSLDGTGKDLLLNFSPVPEPSTWALLACGAGVLGLAARRRRRRR